MWRCWKQQTNCMNELSILNMNFNSFCDLNEASRIEYRLIKPMKPVQQVTENANIVIDSSYPSFLCSMKKRPLKLCQEILIFQP